MQCNLLVLSDTRKELAGLEGADDDQIFDDLGAVFSQ